MDQFDRAQELELASRDAAIAAQRKKQANVTYSHCVDCGDAIPKERQALGGVRRCVGCQEYLEKVVMKGRR